MLQFNRLLVPIDFSQDSLEALRFAIALAKKLSGPQTVIVLTVIDETAQRAVESRFASAEHEADQDAKKEAEARIRAELNNFDTGTETIIPKVIIGETPFKEICQVAKETGVDFIVMGAKGTGALSQLFLGSTIQKVQKHALCPVLSVRISH